MAIATTLERLLQHQGLPYKLVAHPHTESSLRTAQAAHVPAGQLIKAVMLRDPQGFIMAVLPASHRVELGVLHKTLDRPLALATERELEEELTQRVLDCEPGAIPPIGPAYGLETLLEVSVTELPEVYLEAGDHEDLVQMVTGDYLTLLEGVRRLSFSRLA